MVSPSILVGVASSVCVGLAPGYASLSPAQIMERVKALQNLAYKLGVEEGNL